jgi:hypothetical protein
VFFKIRDNEYVNLSQVAHVQLTRDSQGHCVHVTMWLTAGNKDIQAKMSAEQGIALEALLGGLQDVVPRDHNWSV